MTLSQRQRNGIRSNLRPPCPLSEVARLEGAAAPTGECLAGFRDFPLFGGLVDCSLHILEATRRRETEAVVTNDQLGGCYDRIHDLDDQLTKAMAERDQANSKAGLLQMQVENLQARLEL